MVFQVAVTQMLVIYGFFPFGCWFVASLSFACIWLLLVYSMCTLCAFPSTFSIFSLFTYFFLKMYDVLSSLDFFP